jgi:UDP-N-acetylglucosamine--N-acetylmuramyl-(pentapeptide) pyrophosphoryl-undecaprenol N-acetylglucosamine transferase
MARFLGSFILFSKKRVLLENKAEKTIVVAGGGTGGHFYPAVAVAQALMAAFSKYFPDEKLKIHYVGSMYGLEKELVEKQKFTYTLLPIRGFARYFSLKSLGKNLLVPPNVLRSYLKAYALFRQIKPIAFVGTGSYGMAIPGIIAKQMKIPLYLQEQNAYPGVITRILSKNARILFYAFSEIRKYINNNNLRFVESGNPVREKIQSVEREAACAVYGLNPAKKTVFVFGGSQGAQSINEALQNSIKTVMNRWNFQVIWQTGHRNYDALAASLPPSPGLVMRPFIHDMENAYSAADLVISRAGALTIAELIQMSKPAILIPLPTAAANHQMHNAQSLAKKGAVKLILDSKLPEGALINTLQDILANPANLEKMAKAMSAIPKRPATEIIVHEILNDLKSGAN